MNKFIALLLVAVTLPACLVEPGARVRYRDGGSVVVEPEIVVTPAPRDRTTTTRQRETVTYTGCHANDYDYSYSIADCWDGSYEFDDLASLQAGSFSSYSASGSKTGRVEDAAADFQYDLTFHY